MAVCLFGRWLGNVSVKGDRGLFMFDAGQSSRVPSASAAMDRPPGRFAARARRGRRWLPIFGSLLVHGALITIATFAWIRARQAWLASGPSVQIAFDAPGMSEASPVLPSKPSEAPAARPLASPQVRLELEQRPTPSALPEPTSLSDSAAPAFAPADRASVSLPESASMFAVPASAPGGAAAAAIADLEGVGGQRTVAFSGLGASNAQSVVYVVDASGSMVTSLPFVVAELERSVARLSPTQKFGVVLFRRMPTGGDGTETFSPVLVRATDNARQLLHDWLATTRPSGRSNPLAGLSRAAAYEPDAVFLLSRSIERSGGNVWDLGFESTIARVDALNPARRMLIQTIQFLDDDPTGIMQEIGRRHGSSTDSSGRVILGYRLVGRGEDLAPMSSGGAR